MVDPEFAKRCTIPYTNLLKNGHVVKGEVTKCTESEVFLFGKEEPLTHFDYLVIATGTSYAFPFKVPEPEYSKVHALYEQAAADIKEKQNIVCVGGGSTGLESAAEAPHCNELYPNLTPPLDFPQDC